MAHHSFISPDGRWVIIVQMDSRGEILPCRVVPFQGPGEIKIVGPPNGTCLAGAWSPDGKWIYLSAKTDAFHLWRQRFPDGAPEQITFGPTSQEGIAIAPDGKSLITSVGSQDHTVWLHDKDGDHQISFEGDATAPTLSPDGHSLYFLMANGQTRGTELWVKDLSTGDLNTGKLDRVIPGYIIPARSIERAHYSLSPDGKQVAFAMVDQNDRSNIWVAPINHRSSPRHISSAAVEDSPFFMPNGDILFRAFEAGSNFLYRMKADGTDRHKMIPDRILTLATMSNDRHWIVIGLPNPDEEYPVTIRAITLDGTTSPPLCIIECHFTWDATGKTIYAYFPNLYEGSYILPVMPESGLPKTPPAGFSTKQDLATAKSLPLNVESALNPSTYAYTRETTRRNLYRIPLQ
jgi:Tol biopolymer transport system component